MHLTCGQDPADLSHDRLIAAEIGIALKDETKIVSEVVSFVTFSVQFYGKTNDTMLLRRKCDKSAAKKGLRYNISRDVLEIEECFA